MQVHYRVFEHETKGKFVIPMFSYADDTDFCRHSSMIFNANRWASVCSGGKGEIVHLDDWLDVEVVDGFIELPHIVVEVMGSQFAHGGGHVWFISGPLFDEIAAETKKESTDG